MTGMTKRSKQCCHALLSALRQLKYFVEEEREEEREYERVVLQLSLYKSIKGLLILQCSLKHQRETLTEL